jgi:7,8-dihydroneopterin aldolase/epimerase/oxygenase
MTATTPPSFFDLQHTCRKIFLKNYVLPINIGVHDFEKLAPQRVIINVELYVSLEKTTPNADMLNEVLDYDFIRETLKKIVATGHIQLQETLCDQFMTALLDNPLVRAARVSSAKPDVYPDCDAVGIEIFRFKP